MEKLSFKNSRFRILQLSDLQDTYMTNPDTVRLVSSLLKETKPDLIVLTGDQIKGYGFYFLLGNNRTNAAKTLTNLLSPIEKSSIPFTAVFGNHDDFGTADKAFQWELYKLYPNFAGKSYTFDAIPVYSENGDEVKFCIYTFDSHKKDKDGKYIPILPEQVKLYKNERDRLKDENGGYVPALAFQHIPPAEIYDCFESSVKKFSGALQGAGEHKNYYRLPCYAENERSFMGENAASPDERSTQLDAFKEKGDVLGLFFGHDHNNSFIVKHENIDLGYTQSCGFNVYGPGKNRGGRIFDIYENSPDKYETFTVTAADLDDFKLIRPVKSFIYSHSPSSVSQAIKSIKKAAAVTAAAGTAVAAVYFSAKLKVKKR